MAKKKYDHIHRYKKVNLGNNYFVYRCVMPTCTHYISVRLAVGKMCECWRCNEPMVIVKSTLLLTHPHCLDCTKRKSKELETIQDYLEKTQ